MPFPEAGHEPRVLEVIAARLVSAGRIPFAEFMNAALYAPGCGYYMRRAGEPGRHGDFFTSVSVGRCFGDLLALYVIGVWNRLDRPAPFRIIEQGAGEGWLAADLLAALETREPVLRERVRYLLVESSPAARERQAERLSLPQSGVDQGEDLAAAEAGPLPGCLLCNELVDAFPVHLLQWSGRRWEELYVVSGGPPGGFILQPGPLSSPEVEAEAVAIPTDRFPPGYRTEVRPAVHPWLRQAARALDGGTVLIIDYGFPAEEFFDPQRTGGTLRCYRGHRAGDDPFEAIGRQDLTAHVDFSALQRAAVAAGFRVAEWTDQSRFLTRLARDLLLEWERCESPAPGADRRSWLRQFQQLTHPELMGRAFRVLELERERAPAG